MPQHGVQPSSNRAPDTVVMINPNVRLAGWSTLVKAGNIPLLGSGQDQLGMTIAVEVGDGRELQIISPSDRQISHQPR